MNILRRALSINIVPRCYLSISNSAANRGDLKSLQAEKLNERSLIRVAGTEANQFLQGLVTNDIEHLQRSSSAIYALFLNKGGRILYDSIIYRPRDENTLLIECDGRIVQDLIRHLKLFRVRRKISVESLDMEYSVWAIHGGLKSTNAKETTSPSTVEPAFDADLILSQDPRLKNLGTRVVAPLEYNVQDICKLFPENELVDPEDENDYMTLRLKLGVSEGIIDHPPGKALPLESNGDYLHGISFQKGCYLGQELTARTHHTGVIRKRIMPVEISGEIAEGEENMNVKIGIDQSVGVLRGYKNKWGVALIRMEKIVDNPVLRVCGVECSVTKPFWWPAVMPKNNQIGATEAELKT